jgi:hypothetical protein
MNHKRSSQSGSEATLPISKKLVHIVKQLMDSSALDLIRQGILDPNLDIDERRRKAIELFQSTQGAKFWVIDHTSTILRYAHYFRRENKKEIAVLLYATACEHKLNSLVCNFAEAAGLRESEIPQIIRDTSFSARCTWLFKLLKAPPLAQTHLKRLKQLMDLRNEFVHYKWKFESMDDTKEDTRHAELLKAILLTLRYLNAYERKHIYRGARRRSRKIS